MLIQARDSARVVLSRSLSARRLRSELESQGIEMNESSDKKFLERVRSSFHFQENAMLGRTRGGVGGRGAGFAGGGGSGEEEEVGGMRGERRRGC